MKRVITAGTLALGLTWGAAAAGQSPERATGAHADHSQQPNTMAAGGAHAHGPSVPALTYASSTDHRTAGGCPQSHREISGRRAAEADGYRAIGPNVPGMGIHYVRKATSTAFSIDEPPILLDEKDPTSASRPLVVSYLGGAPSGADGQPASSPFPKALASWHKHNNVCVLPDNSASVELTEAHARDAADASRQKPAGWCTREYGRTVPLASSVRRILR